MTSLTTQLTHASYSLIWKTIVPLLATELMIWQYLTRLKQKQKIIYPMYFDNQWNVTFYGEPKGPICFRNHETTGEGISLLF